MELFSRSFWYAGGILLVSVCVAIAILASWSTRYHTSLPINALEADIQLEIQAVRELHSHLDDDKDGQVDSEESEEFVREELSSNSTDRSKTFHKEETLVSSDELWNKWITSKAHNWSCDEMVTWLIHVVELPELAPIFRERSITGRFLPLLAINSSQFLSGGLDINKHQRVKLQIKAMDVVLFGVPPSSESYWKDTVMVMSLILCVMGLTYAWRKQSLAHTKIDRFLEEIRDYELELKTLRERLSIRHNSSDVSVKETTPSDTPRNDSFTSEDTTDFSTKSSKRIQSSQSFEIPSQNANCTEGLRARSYSCDDTHENESLRTKVWTLESQLESVVNDRIALKSLLQESCYSEWSHLESLRKKAEEEVIKAQKVCDKIKRKRSSVIGAFRLANSSTLEDAGLQINRVVNKMQRIAQNFHDYHSRWKKIERVSHLSLTISYHSPSTSSSLSNITSLSSTDSLRGGRSRPVGRLNTATPLKDGLEDVTDESNGSGNNLCEENKTSSSSSGSFGQPNGSSSSLEFTEYEQVGVAFAITNDVRRWKVGSSNETLDIIEEEGSSIDGGSRDIEHETMDKRHFRLNGLKKSRKLKQK